MDDVSEHLLMAGPCFDVFFCFFCFAMRFSKYNYDSFMMVHPELNSHTTNFGGRAKSQSQSQGPLLEGKPSKNPAEKDRKG